MTSYLIPPDKIVPHPANQDVTQSNFLTSPNRYVAKKNLASTTIDNDGIDILYGRDYFFSSFYNTNTSHPTMYFGYMATPYNLKIDSLSLVNNTIIFARNNIEVSGTKGINTNGRYLQLIAGNKIVTKNPRLYSVSNAGKIRLKISSLSPALAQCDLMAPLPSVSQSDIISFCQSSTYLNRINIETKTDSIESLWNKFDNKVPNCYTLSPNPFKDRVTLRQTCGETTEAQIHVFNTTGETIVQTTGTGPETTLDLSGFPAGVYVV